LTEEKTATGTRDRSGSRKMSHTLYLFFSAVMEKAMALTITIFRNSVEKYLENKADTRLNAGVGSASMETKKQN